MLPEKLTIGDMNERQQGNVKSLYKFWHQKMSLFLGSNTRSKVECAGTIF